MPKIDWETQIGRRIRLRDLHVFSTVARCGSMAKAGVQLGISTPTVSEVIANLEHGLGLQLFDRSPKGVDPTRYGQALLKRTHVIFDELKESIKDLEYISDPTSGEVRIASTLSISFTVIPYIFERFTQQYPRVVLHFDEVTAALGQREFQELRDRKYDVILGRGWSLHTDERAAEDLKIETLFNDELVIVAGVNSKWASRRRKIDLAELLDEPWIMQGPLTWNYRTLTDACNARGLSLPRASMVTLSVSAITHFLANGAYITAMPKSVANFKSLKPLLVDLPVRPWPVSLATLKNRTLSPPVERFIECAREYTRPLREKRRAR